MMSILKHDDNAVIFCHLASPTNQQPYVFHPAQPIAQTSLPGNFAAAAIVQSNQIKNSTTDPKMMSSKAESEHDEALKEADLPPSYKYASLKKAAAIHNKFA